jgi:hypothetical protein
VLFRLSWAEISHTERPGRYRYMGGTVDVNRRHIAQWQLYPKGVWEVRAYRPSGWSRTKFKLIRFQVPFVPQSLSNADPKTR